MSKNDTISKLARKAMEPNDTKNVIREKSSIYVSKVVWRDFKKLTKMPRGRTSEVLEEFMSAYIKLHTK